MWYVIQTISGEEQKIITYLKELSGESPSVFVPIYEEVIRSGGKSRISFKKLFPGYIFIETDDPEGVSRYLKRIPDFSRLLGVKEDVDNTVFIPVLPEDEAFLKELFSDGIMHVSYVKLSRTNRIEEVKGPLSRYKHLIKRLEIRHRMAIVEADIFGKRRKIKFGLWTEGDPPLPWAFEESDTTEDLKNISVEYDIGLRPGDRVRDETGVYGDTEFTVLKVDPVHRKVHTRIKLGAIYAGIELSIDNVVLAGE